MNSLFRALGYKVRFFFFVFIKGHFANFRDEETGIKEIIEMAQGVKAIVTTSENLSLILRTHMVCVMTSTYTQNTYFFSK